MIPMRISTSFAGLDRWLRLRGRSVRVAVPLGELVDVPGHDAALGAPNLALVRGLSYGSSWGFAHGFSSSLGLV
jgi:hypothetical protein